MPIFFAQATPYVHQFYRMYFDMADKYGWEQYLPDIPESQVWSLVGPIWDRCTVAWDNNSLLIVVEAETEWDIGTWHDNGVPGRCETGESGYGG